MLPVSIKEFLVIFQQLLGTKWDLFDEQLSRTVAVFQTKKDNAHATDPITGTVQLVGNNRVRGFEFGISGNITPEWNVFGGYTYLDAKLIDDGSGNNDGNKLYYDASHVGIFANVAPGRSALLTANLRY